MDTTLNFLMTLTFFAPMALLVATNLLTVRSAGPGTAGSKPPEADAGSCEKCHIRPSDPREQRCAMRGGTPGARRLAYAS